MDPDTLDLLRRSTLFAATLAGGLVAGTLLAFEVSVMPALARVDDRVFVDVVQRANAAILTPAFLVPFVAAPVAAAAAAALHLPAGARAALPWVAAGFALSATTFVVTAAVNVPLNDRLAAAGPAATLADPHAVRLAFEASWTGWHHVRTVTATAAAGCLGWAALVAGRLP